MARTHSPLSPTIPEPFEMLEKSIQQDELAQRSTKIQEFLKTLSTQQQEQILELLKQDPQGLMSELSKLREEKQNEFQEHQDSDWAIYTVVENGVEVAKRMSGLQRDVLQHVFPSYPNLDADIEEQLVEITELPLSVIYEGLEKMKAEKDASGNDNTIIDKHQGQPTTNAESPAVVPVKTHIIGNNALDKKPELNRQIISEYLRFAFTCQDPALELKVTQILLPDNEVLRAKGNVLIDACEDTILKPLTEVSALTYYKCGEKLNSSKIMDACFDIIKKNKKGIWPTKEDFLDSCKELPDLMHKLVLSDNQ